MLKTTSWEVLIKELFYREVYIWFFLNALFWFKTRKGFEKGKKKWK